MFDLKEKSRLNRRIRLQNGGRVNTIPPMEKVLRTCGWFCVQYGLWPDEHPGCERQQAQGCEGCQYAMWKIEAGVHVDPPVDPGEPVQ